MANDNRDIHQEVDQLKKDLSGLREDMASLLQTLRDTGVEEGNAAGERVRGYGRQARTKVREGVESAQEGIGREIEERPITSTLTAFGVGFVVGMLLDRR